MPKTCHAEGPWRPPDLFSTLAANPSNNEQIERKVEIEVAALNELHENRQVLENSKIALGERHMNDDGAGPS
jgi:hypothetical protein